MIVMRCTMFERLFSSSHTNWCSKLWSNGGGGGGVVSLGDAFARHLLNGTMAAICG